MFYHKKESLANFEKNIFFKSKVTHQKGHEAKEGMKIGGGNSGPVVPNTGALHQVPVLYVYVCSVADSNPSGFEIFCWIRIRIQGNF